MEVRELAVLADGRRAPRGIASLVLLHEPRNGRDAPGLARLMLWLGISATVGANIAYGAESGLLGASDLGLASGGVHWRCRAFSRGP
ncbi:MAG TPA: hypothetical protein VNF47_29065 [Streptosporangiaceae bacterium]|nr:hypothetical protein [Streptosporangiaceae bacterium]